jgi:hypothetical protein
VTLFPNRSGILVMNCQHYTPCYHGSTLELLMWYKLHVIYISITKTFPQSCMNYYLKTKVLLLSLYHANNLYKCFLSLLICMFVCLLPKANTWQLKTGVMCVAKKENAWNFFKIYLSFIKAITSSFHYKFFIWTMTVLYFWSDSFWQHCFFRLKTID